MDRHIVYTYFQNFRKRNEKWKLLSSFLRRKETNEEVEYIKTGCCYFLPFHYHSILVFPKLKIAISFHFHCYFLPLLNLSKNEEWKEIAILKLLFPSTFLLILIIAISFYFSKITISFHFSVWMKVLRCQVYLNLKIEKKKFILFGMID